jgi:putative chitinase
LLSDPSQLESVDLACRSAGWFWKKHGLNELADHQDFLLITKRINGGTNGWANRLALYKKAQEVLA